VEDLLAHRITSAVQGPPYSCREPDPTTEHPERDADDRPDRRGAGEMVDEEAEQGETDDRADEEAAQTEQVAATEWLRHAVIVHRSKLTQRTTPTEARDWLVNEARCAVVIVGGRSVSRGCFGACSSVLAGARETYHERFATLKWIDQPRSRPSLSSGP
jgi:hypothetical protein